jgi:hypothetical protein
VQIFLQKAMLDFGKLPPAQRWKNFGLPEATRKTGKSLLSPIPSTLL